MCDLPHHQLRTRIKSKTETTKMKTNLYWKCMVQRTIDSIRSLKILKVLICVKVGCTINNKPQWCRLNMMLVAYALKE